MKAKHQTSPLQRILLGLGAGIGVALLICLLTAVLVSTQVVPQKYDHLGSAAAIAVAAVTAIKIMSHEKGSPKWIAASLVIGIYAAMMLLGNLMLREPDLGLLGLNLSVLAGAGLLSILQWKAKRKNYRVKY